MTFKPTPYQIEAVNGLITSLKLRQNPVAVLATGLGKSIVLSELFKRLIKANPSIQIICATHSQELVDQNSKKMPPDIPVGIFSAGLGSKDIRQVTFAGIQSIYSYQDIPLTHLLAVDEPQTISRKDSAMWQRFISRLREKNPSLRIIGVTATDWRMDSGSLTSGEDAIFDTVCFEYGLRRGVNDGYLVPLTSKYTKLTYDISKVKKQAGDYSLKDLDEVTNKDELNEQACLEIIEKGHDRKKWLLFCNGVSHSFAIRDVMRRHGISCETVTGETPKEERADILARFKNGDLRCVTNNGVWTTGLDVPMIDLIGMLRHTMSSVLLLQMAGRGTRPVVNVYGIETREDRRKAISESEKPNCLFLDFSRNIERHGFLDDIKAPEKRKKGDGVPPMKACDECFTICHAAARKCPDCGHEFPPPNKQEVYALHTGQIMASDILDFDVQSVSYNAHNVNKQGKTPCLRVQYYIAGIGSVYEYICLQHEGFAAQKAWKWWSDRKGDISAKGKTVEEIVDAGYCDSLHIPKKIYVTKDGKYDRISRVEGLHFPLPDGAEEISAEDFATENW